MRSMGENGCVKKQKKDIGPKIALSQLSLKDNKLRQ